MKFEGEHLLLSFLTDEDLEEFDFKGVLKKAIDMTGANVLGLKEYRFKPFGYSLVFLISESHASVHTYPEVGGVFIDYFTCGGLKTKAFKKHIFKMLKPKKVIEDRVIKRG